MAKEICHVIFPGAFKPVHWGHVSLMLKYLESPVYDVKLTVVISKNPREGILAESSKWFLDMVFKNNKNVKIVIAPDPSPIKTVYDMICTKEYGDGTYALGSSSKGTDIRRSQDIVSQFEEDGKYYTPGVKVIYFPINPEPTMYTGRHDYYNNTPISSTTVRNDIRLDDFESFKSAYLPLLLDDFDYCSRITENDLKIYYYKVKNEILPVSKRQINSSLTESKVLQHSVFKSFNTLNEGGAAGHMSHPYDYHDFTFTDLKDLLRDLFTGKIEDVTEKLDGQNLFASVDEEGNTIFARNKSTLKNAPWYVGDIMHNPNWQNKPGVLHAFTNGALTIDKVFKNIPGRVNLFNISDISSGTKYRYWVNLEIIDTENFNVIPYAESKVSFHNFVKMEKEEGNEWKRTDINAEDNTEKLGILKAAIKKTDNTEFKAQVTPDIIIKNITGENNLLQKYIGQIDKIVAKADVTDSTTIEEYRKEMFSKYINELPELNWITGDVKTALLNRWVNNIKSPDIRTIAKTLTLSNGEYLNKDQYNIIREFELGKSKDFIIKKIMKPLDILFINVGNDILKMASGLSNTGHEDEVRKRLMNILSNIRKDIETSDNETAKQNLQMSLDRLKEVNNELNSTEGIVFRWRGRLMKLTGSFAPLNQILGLGGKR